MTEELTVHHLYLGKLIHNSGLELFVDCANASVWTPVWPIGRQMENSITLSGLISSGAEGCQDTRGVCMGGWGELAYVPGNLDTLIC